MKACIITMVCGHNRYLREFVERNLGIGFGKIYISDHNDPCGERPEDVLDGFGDKVEIADVRERKPGIDGFFDLNTRMVNQFYGKAHEEGFDFAFVQDPDEFLEGVRDVGGWLSSDKFSDASAVCVRWRMYDDNDLVDANGDFRVVDRFTRPMAENKRNRRLNRYKKCLLRTGVFDRIHEHGTGTGESVVDVCGNKYVGTAYAFSPEGLPDKACETVRLAHYKYMTVGEFTRQKVLRFSRWDGNTLDKFFEVNRDTPEKRKLFNDIVSGKVK